MAYKPQDLINIEKVLVEDVLPFYNNELNISASQIGRASCRERV